MPQPTPSRSTQILQAASICFLDRGFVRTSISDIIALSGGSRATVYDEFGDKQGLFTALISAVLDRMELPSVEPGPPEEVLHDFGLKYLKQLLDPEALALYRVVLGECSHVRELGQAIFKAGPEAAAALLAERLRAWAAEGRLAIGDPHRAATMFLAMVEGDLHRSSLMWNCEPSPGDMATNVEAAVALFLDGARPR